MADVYLASRRELVWFAPSAHTDDEVRGWIRDVLIPSGDVTVAEVDGVIVGMMATSHTDGTGWIEQLYLRPDVIRRGIGTALLEHAKSMLQPPIRLYTFQANVAALRFYERHGFVAIEYGDGSGNEERCPDVLLEWRG